MPVLRTIKTYRHGGRKRFIRLYRSWWNMRNRVAGAIRSGNGNAIWEGLTIDPAWVDSFEAFRAWALANGYSRRRCSLDRKLTSKGYGPDNCRWLTVLQNSALAFKRPDPFDMGGVPMISEVDECPF
jgi:hypothetical protein